MPKSFVAAVAVAAILLSACGGDRSAPIPAVTPTPWPGDVVSSTPIATPTPTPTPSQEELVAEAERVYRTFFEEWKRLERAGGADGPTQVMWDTAGGEYLEFITAGLQEQKASRAGVAGDLRTQVVSKPGGSLEGIDPRLTLEVCEDYTRGTFTRDGVTYPGEMVQGTVYLGWVEGRMKLLYADTDAVDKCTL